MRIMDFRNTTTSVMFCALIAIVSGAAYGQSARSQSILLNAGWNAVYLEVDPLTANPDKLFSTLPVDIVATFDSARSGAEFVGDPEIKLSGAYGWSVWYAPARSDAFLGSLKAIYGAKAYLVHATSNQTWVVNGTLAPVQPEWVPNSFNFVGFSVADPGGPTFEQFFASSPAHNHNRIYRLVNGVWQQLLDPGGATMRSGEAFWIHCDRHSTYSGPLAVSTVSHLGLVLSSDSGSELVLRNRTGHPLSLTLEHDVAAGETIPLSMPVFGFDEEAKATRSLSMDLGSGDWIKELPVLDAGAAMRIPLNLKLQEMAPGTYQSVMTVRSDIGTVNRVALSASRDD